MNTRVVSPGSFQAENHFYPRVPNAVLHPMVRSFFALGNDRIAQRYAHLHPEVDPAAVRAALDYRPRYLRWAGADLLHVTTDKGVRRNVVIETNSCPSGQKSMPLLHDDEDRGGYLRLLQRSFEPLLARRGLGHGRVAVLWDKNEMETSGYAAVLADLIDEDVLLVRCPADDPDPSVRMAESGRLEVRDDQGEWHELRAAFRYVTQRPWTRIPPLTKTAVFNPVLACLAGGRNKLLAAKAYDLFNAEVAQTGLKIRVPETIWDVAHQEVPLWVARMGGVAVVKDPYSNAGQGVWTITSAAELEHFMELPQRYDRFIVQGLVGNVGWSSRTREGRLYHIGTVPNRRGEIFAADLRLMVAADPTGFYPVAVYARRAREPLAASLAAGTDSWAMLGTNLSVKLEAGRFTTEPDRLMLVDQRDFNRLGLGIDDLTEAYLQAVLATTAIDKMAQRLVSSKGTFRRRFFKSLNPDAALAEEICK